MSTAVMNTPNFKLSVANISKLNASLVALCRSNQSYSWLPDGGTWSAGGCRVLSEALLPILGDSHNAEIVTIQGRNAYSAAAPSPQHIVVRLTEPSGSFFIDADGLQTEKQMLTKMESMENLSDLSIMDYCNNQCDEASIYTRDDWEHETRSFISSSLSLLN
jgi:hypothetical protein